MITTRRKKRPASATGRPCIQRRYNIRSGRKQIRLFNFAAASRLAGGSSDEATGWRDFYDGHEAAEFFHSCSDPEQLKELADDIDKQGVIFFPIHTATVPGRPRPFVIDGISRLDAAEATGRKIVNEKGEWTEPTELSVGAQRPQKLMELTVRRASGR